MRDFRMRIAGVNHFTWLIRGGSEGAGCHEGEVHEAIRAKGVTEKEDAYAKSLLNARISAQLADVFGAGFRSAQRTHQGIPFRIGRDTGVPRGGGNQLRP